MRLHFKKFNKIIILFILCWWCLDTCIVFANMHIIEADGVYIVNNELKENINIARKRARMEAKRAAVEKAGIFIESMSTVENGQLIKDEINTISANIIKINDEKITIDVIDGNTYYKCHIVAMVDSTNITDQLNQDRQRLYEVTEQYKRQEVELNAIKNELLALKTKYKIANTEEKQEINKKIKNNESRFVAMEYVDEGNNFYYNRDYEHAIECYLSSVEIVPNLVIAWNNLGMSYCQIGDFLKSIEYLLMAAKLEPTNHMILNNIGYAYGQLGDYKQSIKYLRKATIELDSNWSPAWTNLSVAYSNVGDYQAAIIYGIKATQLDTNNVYALNNLGAAYNDVENYQKAIECLQKAIILDDKSAIIWFNIGYAYGKLDCWDKAMDCLSKAYKLKPQNKKYEYAFYHAKQMRDKN